MNKLMDTIIEINTKGTIQEQSEKLYNELYCYKKLIATYNVEIENVNDSDLLEELSLMREKYEIRLDNIKMEMVRLNRKIVDTMDTLTEIELEFEDFVEVFKLKEDEIDSEESFYSNLMMSSNPVGQVVRTGVIESEKYLMEMMEED